MMIELKPDGSFRIYQHEGPGWYVLGRRLWWLTLGVLLGLVAARAYYLTYLAF